MGAKSNAGDVLRRARQYAGLTQCEVAEQVRHRGQVTLSETHYRRIETGTCLPSVTLAMNIAEVVESDVYEIWG